MRFILIIAALSVAVVAITMTPDVSFRDFLILWIGACVGTTLMNMAGNCDR